MFCWGLADFFAKKTVDKVDAPRTLLWMQFFGLVPLFIYLLFNWEPARINPQIIFFLLLLGLGNAIAYLLFYRGLGKGFVSILSPVFASQAAIAVLVSAFLFGESIAPSQWLGLAFIFIGIILASFKYWKLKNEIEEISKTTKGTLKVTTIIRGIMVNGFPEVLVGAIIFGFFFPFWDRFLGYQETGWVTSTIILRFVAIAFLAGLIYFLARRGKIQPEFGTRTQEKKIWVWLILIGMFDALAALFAAWGYRFTTFTSVIVMVSAAFPLPTVILARIFLKEKLVKNQVIGIAAIILGLIVLAI